MQEAVRETRRYQISISYGGSLHLSLLVRKNPVVLAIDVSNDDRATNCIMVYDDLCDELVDAIRRAEAAVQGGRHEVFRGGSSVLVSSKPDAGMIAIDTSVSGVTIPSAVAGATIKALTKLLSDINSDYPCS